MTYLLGTLSLSYVRRHRMKTALTLAGVLAGVATFCSIRSARETLISSMRSTIDRIAGKAQMQITGPGGVPEELQEKLRDMPGIEAMAPVIEQVATSESAGGGSLLVLGIDLLGDRKMREYGFEGEDADIDDPLLFLAQPDSIALSRSYAERAGVKQGDSILLRAGQQTRRVVVRGLIRTQGFAEAFGGNVAVTDVYAAQELFGRGRRFDRIEVRLEEGRSIEDGASLLAAALGPAYKVETPERRGEQAERIINNFVAGFDISSTFALGIGAFLIYNAFTVAVSRRRRDIGILRAVGATPRQVQALFLIEAVVLGIVGAALGAAVGTAVTSASLKIMQSTVEKLYGFADVSHAVLQWQVIAQSIALGLIVSIVGAWAPARAAARIHPVAALAAGTFTARRPQASTLRTSFGISLLSVAAIISVWHMLPGGWSIVAVLVCGIIGVMLVIGPVARFVLTRTVPLITRLSPVTGRLAADSLLSHPRRTTGTITAITLTLAFVIGTGGYVASTRDHMLDWMHDITTADIYLRASARFTRPDFRFPSSLLPEILAIPGVRSVECFRNQSIPFRGDEIALISIEIMGLLDRVQLDFLDGSLDDAVSVASRRDECAVSDNFHRRYGIGRGDLIELPGPDGIVRLKVAAVLADFTSDKGSVMVDRSTFVSIWKDDLVDIYEVNAKPGVDIRVLRDEIVEKLGSRMPALVQTREEFSAEVQRAIDAFFALTRVTVMMSLLVAFMGIITSLLVSVAERTREIGILKAVGALGAQIRRSVLYEALAVSLAGLALALPIGFMISVFLARTVAEITAGWKMPVTFPTEILSELVVALPLTTLFAAWLPARRAARLKVTEAVSYE